MENCMRETSARLHEVQLGLMTIDRCSSESEAQNVKSELHKIFQAIDECFKRLDIYVSREDPTKRHEARRKVDQLRSDSSFVKSSYGTLMHRLQHRWKVANDREELLKNRFQTNNHCAISMITDRELEIHQCIHSSNKGIDKLIDQGVAVLGSLQSQHSGLRSVRQKIRDIGSMLGLSDTTLALAYRRSSTDFKLFVCGCMLFIVFMSSRLNFSITYFTRMEPAVVHVATAEPEEFSGNRLFVCNLPFRYRDVDLMGMFANFAPVSAEIAYNERGSRGFGFVTLATVNDAEYARSCVNGIIIEARVIEVRRATMTMREKTRRAQMAASNRTGTQLQNVQNGASPTAANCLLGLAQMQMQQLQSAVMFNQQDVLQAALQRQLLQNLQSAGISVLPQASQQINAQLIQQQLQARAAAAVPLSVSGSNLFAPFGSTISAQSFVPQHVPQLANLLVQQQIQQAHIEKEQIAHLQSSVSPLSKNEAKRLLSWKLNAPATMVSNELVKAYSESVSLSLCLLNDFNSDSTNVSEALLSSDAYKEHLSCMRDERRRMSYSGTTLKDLENNKMNNVIYPQSSELSISSDMKARESTSSDVSSTSPTSSIRKRIRSDPDVAVEGLPNADESKKDQIDCCFSDCNLRDGESNPCKGGLDVNHNEPSGKRVKTD